MDLKRIHQHYHCLWKWYDMKRQERHLCMNLNVIGDTWRDMERRQDELADFQLEIEEFEVFNKEALELRDYEL